MSNSSGSSGHPCHVPDLREKAFKEYHKTKTGSIIIPDFKVYYKPVIIKTVCYWHKNRHIDQWDRTENPEMNPQFCGLLIFNKAGMNIK